MVTPDYSAYDQDRAPGMVRELHETLAARPITFRNQPERDYDALVKATRLLSVQCDDGYVLGLPYGRHLRLFYEFDTINHIRLHLTNLLNDMGELALEHSECELMTLDYNDFPHRHYVEPMLIGAAFPSPAEVSVVRCRDIREQAIPALNPDISVREASVEDADAIADLEQRAAGEAAHAPPLSEQFFAGAAWVGIAEIEGRPGGYIHLAEAEKRGLAAEELVAAPDQPFSDVSGALLAAAMAWGAERNRRSLTLRVAMEAMSDPLLAQFGFRHITNELFYQRPADPAEIERLHDDKVVTYVKVGKIWGRF